MKVKIKTALVSVSDKAGLQELVDCLKNHNIKIISTGGTSKAIKKLNFKFKYNINDLIKEMIDHDIMIQKNK